MDKPFLAIMKYSSIEISIDEFATLDEAVKHLEQFGEGAEKTVAIRVQVQVPYSIPSSALAQIEGRQSE